MIHGTCRDPASLVSHSLSIRNLGDLDVRSRLNRGVGQDPLVRGIVGPLRHLKIRHLEHVFPFFLVAEIGPTCCVMWRVQIYCLEKSKCSQLKSPGFGVFDSTSSPCSIIQ